MPLQSHYARATTVTVAVTVGAVAVGSLLYQRRTRCRAQSLSRARVVLISSADDWNRHRNLFVEATLASGVVGLDCEWVSDRKSGRRRKVALLQWAPNEHLCFVVRLSALAGIPVELADALDGRLIVKVGVDVTSDAAKLATDYHVMTNSCLDLRYLATGCAKSLALLQSAGLSLQKLADQLVGVKLDKSVALRCSNWEADVLTRRELTYAANDALAAFLVAKKVASLMTGPVRVLCQRSWMHSVLVESFEHRFDMPFVQRWRRISEAESQTQAGLDADMAKLHQVRIKKTSRQAVRKSPLYDNCVLEAPDGDILASVKRKKAEWYLEKGIAQCVAEEPFTVRLTFEPKGRAILDKVYYTIHKQNRCVVCGDTEKLVRKNIIPSEYRSFFPEVMSSHNSHDVLPMCVVCHQRSNAADFSLRERLAVTCNAPLSEHKYRVNLETNKLIRAAKALSRPSAANIPPARRQMLEDSLKELLHVDQLTPECIEQCASMDPKLPNENYVCHGMVVVEYFANNGGLLNLEAMWRKHFLRTMKPRCLPTLWSVDHHRRSLAYDLSTWPKDEALQMLQRVGLSWEFVEEVRQEIEELKRARQRHTSSETANGNCASARELDQDSDKKKVPHPSSS